MSTEKSTFLQALFRFDTRYLSKTEIESLRGTRKHLDCDLIDFLALVQSLELAILPITWQSARDRVGRGGSGIVNEALINLQTSLVFKCVSNDLKLELKTVPEDQTRELRRDILQTFVNEVNVLGHRQLREHPNIVDLQGVCWDVKPDNDVWPVLVFEKTHFGDMHSFLTLPIGRDLSLTNRLRLCDGIATAIIDMHSIGALYELKQLTYSDK